MKVFNFAIEDIDGCEFVVSSNVGKMIISHYQDSDGFYTGEIHVIYADGSQTKISQEEAQRKIDKDEWVIIR